MFEATTLEGALTSLGALLQARDIRAEIVVIGGGGLLLLGLGVRPTEDCDVVAIRRSAGLYSAQPLPPEILTAAVEVARARDLDEDWLNAGPTDLLRHGLPHGFMDRVHRRDYGTLTVFIASRLDQIHFKLLATSSPRDKHALDLRVLRPTQAELEQAAAWAHARSAGGFSPEIAQALEYFTKQVGRRG